MINVIIKGEKMLSFTKFGISQELSVLLDQLTTLLFMMS